MKVLLMALLFIAISANVYQYRIAQSKADTTISTDDDARLATEDSQKLSDTLRSFLNPRPTVRGRAHPGVQRLPVLSHSYSQQHDARCAFSQEVLQSVLKQKAKTVRSTLLEALDERTVIAEAEDQLNTIFEILKIPPNDQQIFEREFQDYYARSADETKTLLENDPPDWASIFIKSKRQMQEEDEMVKKYFGNAGLEKFRKNQLETRTVGLMLYATYAGIPWDDEKLFW